LHANRVHGLVVVFFVYLNLYISFLWFKKLFNLSYSEIYIVEEKNKFSKVS